MDVDGNGSTAHHEALKLNQNPTNRNRNLQTIGKGTLGMDRKRIRTISGSEKKKRRRKEEEKNRPTVGTRSRRRGHWPSWAWITDSEEKKKEEGKKERRREVGESRRRRAEETNKMN
jgi:hypothetical protein